MENVNKSRLTVVALVAFIIWKQANPAQPVGPVDPDKPPAAEHPAYLLTNKIATYKAAAYKEVGDALGRGDITDEAGSVKRLQGLQQAATARAYKDLDAYTQSTLGGIGDDGEKKWTVATAAKHYQEMSRQLLASQNK